jgi:hypothetical protein
LRLNILPGSTPISEPQLHENKDFKGDARKKYLASSGSSDLKANQIQNQTADRCGLPFRFKPKAKSQEPKAISSP